MSEGRNQNNRDPLAIAVAALGLVTQVGIWIWWGARIDQRVTTLEAFASEARKDERSKITLDGTQNMQIAVITTELKGIKESVERIDRKIPERR